VAWRNIIGSIIAEALREIVDCAKGEDAALCAEKLVAAADALYAPLKPVDSGLGEARRIASLLAGIVVNAFLAAAREREDSEVFLRDVLARLAELKTQPEPVDAAREILERAGGAVFPPAVSREARETIYSDLAGFVEPPKPVFPRRRRQRQLRRPDPQQTLRRLLRELGRRDPMLAKQASQLLKELGVF